MAKYEFDSIDEMIESLNEQKKHYTYTVIRIPGRRDRWVPTHEVCHMLNSRNWEIVADVANVHPDTAAWEVEGLTTILPKEDWAPTSVIEQMSPDLWKLTPDLSIRTEA